MDNSCSLKPLHNSANFKLISIALSDSSGGTAERKAIFQIYRNRIKNNLLHTDLFYSIQSTNAILIISGFFVLSLRSFVIARFF